jgi:hypothetical protein
LDLPRTANSVSATNGSIWYQIQVNGIDTSQLRQDILRILREPRLGLVNDELSENIKDGQLFIQGVNTAKASFIINSLKALPVEVQWQMYAKDPSSDHN